MKRLVKFILIFVIVFEVLMVTNVISIVDKKVKRVHDDVLEKMVKFVEGVWKKIHDFFCGEMTKPKRERAMVDKRVFNGQVTGYYLTVREEA